MRELVDTTGDARSPVDALAGAPWASTRDSLRPVAFAALFATLAAATATALTARRRRGGNAADDATDDDDDARDDGDAPPADAPRRPKSATATADLHRALTLSFALVLAATAWLAIIAPRDHTRDASGRYLDVRAALAVVERLARRPRANPSHPSARDAPGGRSATTTTSTFRTRSSRTVSDPISTSPALFPALSARASPRRRSARPPPRISAAVSCAVRIQRRRVEARVSRAALARGAIAPRVYGASRTPRSGRERLAHVRGASRGGSRGCRRRLARPRAENRPHPNARMRKIRALTRAAAAFFGTNVFDHPFGSDVEDPNDGLDDEDAQLEAHARYVRVLEAEVAAYADAHGDDADLLAFLGEARVNLTPWRYWRVRTEEEDDDGDAGDKDDDGNVSNGSVRVESVPGVARGGGVRRVVSRARARAEPPARGAHVRPPHRVSPTRQRRRQTRTRGVQRRDVERRDERLRLLFFQSAP